MPPTAWARDRPFGPICRQPRDPLLDAVATDGRGGIKQPQQGALAASARRLISLLLCHAEVYGGPEKKIRPWTSSRARAAFPGVVVGVGQTDGGTSSLLHKCLCTSHSAICADSGVHAQKADAESGVVVREDLCNKLCPRVLAAPEKPNLPPPPALPLQPQTPPPPAISPPPPPLLFPPPRPDLSFQLSCPQDTICGSVLLTPMCTKIYALRGWRKSSTSEEIVDYDQF